MLNTPGIFGENWGTSSVFIIDVFLKSQYIVDSGNCLCKLNPYTEILMRISHMISCRVSIHLFCWEGFFLCAKSCQGNQYWRLICQRLCPSLSLPLALSVPLFGFLFLAPGIHCVSGLLFLHV